MKNVNNKSMKLMPGHLAIWIPFNIWRWKTETWREDWLRDDEGNVILDWLLGNEDRCYPKTINRDSSSGISHSTPNLQRIHEVYLLVISCSVHNCILYSKPIMRCEEESMLYLIQWFYLVIILVIFFQIFVFVNGFLL